MCTLLGVGLYAARQATQQRAEFVGQQLLSSARSAAFQLAVRLQEREKEVEILSRVPSLVESRLNSPRVLRSLQLRKEINDEYVWIGVADTSGRLLNATGGLINGAEVRQRPWFAAGLRGPYTGDVHDDAQLARRLAHEASDSLHFIDLAAPVRDHDGEVRGVLAAHVRWQRIARTVTDAVRGDPAALRTEAMILARDGTLLFPLHAPGMRLPEAPGPGRFGVQTDADGRAYLVARAAVPATAQSDLGWSVVLRQPLEVATAPISALRDRLFIVGLVASLLVAALAYVLAVRLSRPLEQLAAAVVAVREGRSSAAFPQRCGSPELEAMTESVRAMTESLLDREARLEQANALLEQTVDDRTRQLSAANAELARLASQDALTGLANRRAFEQRAADEEARARRTGRGIGLLMLDVDLFKSVNDRFGHSVGDRVLQEISRLLEASIRETDLAARLGGEEFAVLLPELAGPAEAALVAEKIRLAVQGHGFAEAGHVTLSIGVAWADGHATPVVVALQRADEALYAAKRRGRNCCVSADDSLAG
ncbi:diguanylate cyclase (GGDEF)-like protein [Rubrivivax gelatinosus]|uniref:sensor domain-containing diguanylate cyclase n=3 Tax=Rubrivivax gelatinosus TaxID=28068 RepID=UPI001A181E42|nr:sensor domain-containing diguanylate cyclase [Rubrivivax gelatinosus]MBG6081811.1 diguanylate cyclase (GGDEF)-like protein [Rubrivivax gelatinosus]